MTSYPHRRPLTWEEACKLNGTPGYTASDCLQERERRLALAEEARPRVSRSWATTGHQERNCGVHGAYISTELQLLPPVAPPLPPIWTACPYCDDEIAREQSASATTSPEMRAALERRRLEDAGIPAGMVDSQLRTYQHRVPAMDRVWKRIYTYTDTLHTNITQGRNLLLLGGTGTGKTHLGIAVLRHLLLSGAGTGHYTTQAQFVSRIKATMDRDWHENELEVFAILTSVDLLFLDEVGRANSDWERGLLFRLIDERHRKGCKPTIIASNCTTDALTAEVSAAGWDRLRDRQSLLERLSWESQRG